MAPRYYNDRPGKPLDVLAGIRRTALRYERGKHSGERSLIDRVMCGLRYATSLRIGLADGTQMLRERKILF